MDSLADDGPWRPVLAAAGLTGAQRIERRVRVSVRWPAQAAVFSASNLSLSATQRIERGVCFSITPAEISAMIDRGKRRLTLARIQLNQPTTTDG